MTATMEEEQEAVDRLSYLKETIAKDTADSNYAAARASSTVMIIVSVASVIIAVFLGLFLANIICKPIGNMVGAAEKLAAGDMNVELDVKTKDEIGVLSESVNKIVQSIKELVEEAGKLTHAAIEGRLNTRANSNKYQGAYRDIVQGVNDTLDAVIGPLNVAADYVDRISKGDI